MWVRHTGINKADKSVIGQLAAIIKFDIVTGNVCIKK